MARSPGTRTTGASFDAETIEAVWKKGKPDAQDASVRRDACNASMQRSKYGKTEKFGWEIDHIKPVARDGTDELSNLQPLQWENNRHKSDSWPEWTCKIKT